MVSELSEYHWSSYQINALGKNSSLCTPHTEYLNLGATDLQRQNNYRALFKTNINEKLTAEIRLSLNKSLALGNEHFKDEVELLSGRRVKERKRGRPLAS